MPALLAFIRCLSVVLVMLTGLSVGSPIRSPENHHRGSVVRDTRDNPLLDSQDFVSQFLSTLNLTEQRPQPRPLAAAPKEPVEYMLELYNRFTRDRTAVPSANVVRSFKNQDSSPYSVTGRGVRIHPLLFNISMPHHEHVTIAELRLVTLVRRNHRPHAGLDCKVTVYQIHEGVVWTQEVEREQGRRDRQEVVELKDLEELVTKRVRARDNSWLSFDLTRVVALWRKSGCATHRLEVHIASLGSGGSREEVGVSPVEVDIDRNPEGRRNAALIVFSDDRKHDKQELDEMIGHESVDLPEQQEAFRGHVAHGDNILQLQSNLIHDTAPRIRRHAKSEAPCKRTPLFVDFKDIGWDAWIIQPLGYEAYECNGVCNPPLTSEVSPTKHAMVQTLLSVRSPERASRACCVPTKLEPISLLYHDNGVITFNHKYEGMVVAECGCR